jgi:CRP/FNR family transcriptional regulator
MSPNLAINTGHAAPRPSMRAAGRRAELRAELAALDQVGSVVTLKREETLFYEGDVAEHYFKVVTGAVRSCRLLPDGRRHIGDFYLPGDFIALSEVESYLFTAEAVTDVTLVRYVRRNVDQLIGQRPQLGTCLFAMVCDGLSSAQEQMLLLGRKTAQEKIASFLLMMAEREGQGDRVVLPMTRTDIGDYLGLTTETVSRTLTQLKNEGVITVKGIGEVNIADRETLEDMADGL